jgi:predicted permease
VSELLQDLKFACRTLWRSPGFTVVALLTIAVGIGANVSIFSYIDGVLLRPLPYHDSDRMVRVMEKPPNGNGRRLSGRLYQQLEQQTQIFDRLTAQNWNTAALTGIAEPIQVANERVSLRFFDVFTNQALIGRTFVAGEDQAGHDHVAVLSHAFWVSEFNADPHVLGRSILLDGDPFTVVGILPAGTFDRTMTKIWRPLAFSKEELNYYARQFMGWGVLRAGVSLAQARAQLDALAAATAHDFPESNKGWGLSLDSFDSIIVDTDVRRSLYLLMGAVGMVLLIACANLANLTLARGASREREVAIRAALGAGRWRLTRQFLTESLLLSLGGCVLGLLGAYAGLAGLKRVIPGHYLPPTAYVEMDGRMLLFTVGLALLTGLIFGLYPSIRASRPNLVHAIKQGGVGASAGASGHGLRRTLVTIEVALAFVLLTAAGLLIHSFFKIQQVDPGFDASHVLTARLPITTRRFPTQEGLLSYLHRVVDRVGGLPGVRDAALTSELPMEGWGWGMPFDIAGQKSADLNHRPVGYFKMVGASYFQVLGMHLARGRLLDPRDLAGTVPVAVINQTMAARYFKDRNPIGEHLLIPKVPYGNGSLGADIPWEIVGVVADEKLRGLGDTSDGSPGIYVPVEQACFDYQSLVVRTVGDPKGLLHALSGAIHDVDPDQTVDQLRTLDDIKDESVGDQRLQSLLLGIFGTVALLLSAIGLYGVIAYGVTQRTREIGIRSALGATRGSILWLVLRSGLTLTAVGLLVGVAGSFGVAQVLGSMLFEVPKYDPWSLGAVATLMVAMALLACYLPARRAVKVNPIVALRQD